MRGGPAPLLYRPGGTRTPNRRFWRPVLYQLSYGPLSLLRSRTTPLLQRWPGTELNRRHLGFQPSALPTELPGPNKTPVPNGRGRFHIRESWDQLYRRAIPARVPGLDQVSARSHAGTRFGEAHQGRPVTACINISPPFLGAVGPCRTSSARASRLILNVETPPPGRRSSLDPNSGGGIRTRDLRVMSPTSYQTAPPRIKDPKYMDGRGWVSTLKPSRSAA